MATRIFGFIWGAILLAMLLFGLLINLLGWAPPENAKRAFETEFIVRELSIRAESGGVKAALATWESIAAAHPGFQLARDPTCTGETLITDNMGQCLALFLSDPIPPMLSAVEPIVLPLLIGAVSSAIVSLLMSQWITRPLRVVGHGLKQLARGELAARIRPNLHTTNSELQELGLAFDDAATRLQQLSEGRQRLFHDISHEIRSPLSRLQAAIALLEVNPLRKEMMLRQMTGDIHRLNQLVEEILTLARIEQDGLRPLDEWLNLMEVLSPILDDANFEGKDRGVRVTYHGPEKIRLKGNSELIHRAFENVIRNALRYSPDGGEVEVSGRLDRGQVTIDVSDRGPGVASTDLEALFLPFIRAGEGPYSEGVGLGLAIAASSIKHHSGTIAAHLREGGGLTIRTTLPTAPG